MTAQARQPAGVPAGGQFAASARTESNVALRPPVPSAQQRDELAMDRIALRLGAVEEWDGSSDYLEFASTELAGTGRPSHDLDADEYQAAFDSYLAQRTGPVSDTTRTLDQMALTLGTSEDCGADELQRVAELVGQSGRPQPGDVDPDEYIARIANARAARASTFEDAQAEIAEGLGNYLDRQQYLGELEVEFDGFTAHVEEGDDGTLRYSRTITVRGKGDMDEGLDVTGTAAEGLLDDLALYSPWVDKLVEVTR